LIGYSVSEISTNDLQYFYNNIKRFLMLKLKGENRERDALCNEKN